MGFFAARLIGVPEEILTQQLPVRAMPRILGRLVGLSLKYPGLSLSAVLAALAAALFNILVPRLLGHAVDVAHQLLLNGAVAPDRIWRPLLWNAGLIIGANTARGLMTGLHGYLGEVIAQKVGLDLRLAFFNKLQELSFSFHDRVHSSELIARGMLDIEGVRGFQEAGLLRLITLVMLTGVGTWQVMRTDLVTGALALSFVPVVAWRAVVMARVLRLSWMSLQEIMSGLTRIMEENLQGIRVVRAFSAVKFELSKFDHWAARALDLSNRRITYRIGAVSLMNTIYYASMALAVYVGGLRITAGYLSVGGLTEILTFITILQMPVRQLAMIVNSSARATSSGLRLFEILDTAPEIADRPHTRDLAITEGTLRFDAVEFRYPGAAVECPTLSRISFTLERGRTLGIVGPPGSGKSTIAQLIPRLYDVTGGSVTIDGQDVRHVTLASVRRAVSLIQQEVFLFDGSVHDNIAYTEPFAPEHRVVEVARTAQLHGHVSALPEAYRTRVGERGVALSGGQRQRLSIARGLIPGPTILILDDSTAAIDAATERAVREGLRDAARSAATIIIAHRLSAVRHADEILVLDGGRIVERGTHQSLLALGGVYASIWRLQCPGLAT